jgi:hypothetical protein
MLILLDHTVLIQKPALFPMLPLPVCHVTKSQCPMFVESLLFHPSYPVSSVPDPYIKLLLPFLGHQELLFCQRKPIQNP